MDVEFLDRLDENNRMEELNNYLEAESSHGGGSDIELDLDEQISDIPRFHNDHSHDDIKFKQQHSTESETSGNVGLKTLSLLRR